MVAIVGTNFASTWFTAAATDNVTFGGTTVPFTYGTATGGTLTVTAPTHAPGAVTVTVTTPNGTSTGYGYTYAGVPTITGITPDAGPVGGGNLVTIAGTGFTATATVTFGGTPSPTVVVVSLTQLQTTAPPPRHRGRQRDGRHRQRDVVRQPVLLRRLGAITGQRRVPLGRQ